MTNIIAIEGFELKKVQNGKCFAIVPKWARFQFVESYFGIGYRNLLEMVADGKVRMRKSGDEKTSTAIFCVEDIDEVINLDWVDGKKLYSKN